MTQHLPPPGAEPPLVHPERLAAAPAAETVIDGDFSWLDGGASKPLKPRELMEAYGFDRMLEEIAGGMSVARLAEQIGVSVGGLYQWQNATPERATMVKEARRLAAMAFDEQAEAEIKLANDPISLGRARELATHLRWRSKAVAPKDYGDRQQIDLDAKVQLSSEQLASKLEMLTDRARKLTSTP